MQRYATNRPRMTFRLATAVVLASAVFGPATRASACNIPVFRYALERWHPDPYRLTLFHRGPLTAAQQALIKPWQEPTSASTVNVALRLVDVEAVQDDADRALFAAQTKPQLPWLMVQYPKGSRIEKTVWAGPPTHEVATRLGSSPVRTELIRRLADGQTAVWLLLECGDAAKDAAASAQLEKEIKQLAEKLELPELSTSPEDELQSDAPLRVEFSLLRVSREASAEQALIDVLLHSEPDLLELAEPMVFPVFGRGRALLPLIGDGITSDNIHESAAFLVGACSCEIKELNPGFDLLLSADWDLLLFKKAPPAEIVAARTAVVSDEPELVAIPRGASAAIETATPSPRPSDAASESVGPDAALPKYAAGILGVAVLAGIFAFALRR